MTNKTHAELVEVKDIAALILAVIAVACWAWARKGEA